MFTCTDLSISLASGRKLVDSLSFSLQPEDRLAIIAEEGNGKSTLMKLFAGDHPDYVSITGSFYTDLHLGYLPQQIESEWMKQIPADYLIKQSPDEPPEQTDWNRLADAQKAALKLNIDPGLIDRDQNIETLSGGEKVRLMFIRMMIDEPNGFLLDEPTNDLDQDALEWIESWIKEADGPVLFISHDARFLKNCATRILHLEQRNKKTKNVTTLFDSSYVDYLAQRSSSLAKLEQISASEKREYRAQKERLNDLRNKVEGKLKTVSRQRPHEGAALKKSMKTVKNAQAHLEEEGYTKTDSIEEEIGFILPDTVFPEGKMLLEIEHQPLKIEDRILAEDVSLSLKGPVRLIITGNNGAGKTTLLQAIEWMLTEVPGVIAGYLPQNYDELFEADVSPLSYLEAVCQDRVRAGKALGSMKLTEGEMNQSIFSCSSGQKAKIILAGFAMQGCNVLLLDEPIRNLSVLSASVFSRQLSAWKGAVIAVSHDREFIESSFTMQAQIKDQKWSVRMQD